MLNIRVRVTSEGSKTHTEKALNLLIRMRAAAPSRDSNFRLSYVENFSKSRLLSFKFHVGFLRLVRVFFSIFYCCGYDASTSGLGDQATALEFWQFFDL